MLTLQEILFCILGGGLVALALVGPLVGLIRSNRDAYELFRTDKVCSQNSEYRISEWRLLNAARNWGWLGAKLAQFRFHHKTRKEPFRSDLNRIGMILGVKLVGLFTVMALVVLLPQARALSGDLGRSLRQSLGPRVIPVVAVPAGPAQVRPQPRPEITGG